MSKIVGIVLAGGRGKRMNSAVPKQYLELNGYPVLYYALRIFQESFVDEIIVVTAESEIAYCQREIVERYGFSKVTKVVAGGKERYHSVYQGLQAIQTADYVYIHDGARPFVTVKLLEQVQKQLEQQCGSTKACVVGMPVKDTIKIVNKDQYVTSTPERDLVWAVQTPQAFSFDLVKKAYDKLMQQDEETIQVTDDAMVVELMLSHPIQMVKGSYRNIKITTPEDLDIARIFLNAEENG